MFAGSSSAARCGARLQAGRSVPVLSKLGWSTYPSSRVHQTQRFCQDSPENSCPADGFPKPPVILGFNLRRRPTGWPRTRRRSSTPRRAQARRCATAVLFVATGAPEKQETHLKGKSLLKVLSMADFLPASETRLPAGHTDNTRSGPHTRRTLPVGNPGCRASGGVPCVRTSARSPASAAGQSCATALPLLASPREWHSRARPRRTTRRRNEGSDSVWVPPWPEDRGSHAGHELVFCLRPRAT